MLYVTLAIVLIVGGYYCIASWWGMRKHYSVDDLDPMSDDDWRLPR